MVSTRNKLQMKTIKKGKTVTRTVRSFLSVVIVFTLVMALSLVPTAYAAAGALDPTFGAGGRVTTDFTTFTPAPRNESMGVALQSDGQIIVVGSATHTTLTDFDTDVVVARYNKSNGSLDTTFDTDGKRVDGKGANTTSKAFAVAIQPSDGKIVVVGSSDWLGTAGFMLRRYLTNGTPDNTIDGSGDTDTIFSGLGNLTASQANAVAIQADDGKIVLAGSVQNGSELHDFVVARYCPTDGLLDDGSNCPGSREAGFNTASAAGTGITPAYDGTIVMAIDSQNQTDDIAHAVAINPRSHKIVVVGESNTNLAMVQYNENGRPDTGFGANGNGIVTDGLAGPAFGVVIQSDDKIVVVGTKSVTVNNSPNCIGSEQNDCDQFEFYVARFMPNGTPDTSFSGDGQVTTAMNTQGNDDQAFTVAIQPADGKIVVAGFADVGINEYPHSDPWINFNHNKDFALARYNTNGSLDTTFDTDGKVTTDFSGSLDAESHGVAIQSVDGKIVLAGYNEGNIFALARYTGALKNVYLPLLSK
jgi:uncharacterized delta-60 repeat protein